MPKPSNHKLYGHKWQVTRAGFLRKHPLCVFCERQGRATLATVVDHIEPHRCDKAKFWDRANWQPLCKPCHDGAKQRLERSGTIADCDTAGVPLDPNHHWNQAEKG